MPFKIGDRVNPTSMPKVDGVVVFIQPDCRNMNKNHDIHFSPMHKIKNDRMQFSSDELVLAKPFSPIPKID